MKIVLFRNKAKYWIVLAHDSVAIVTAWLLAYIFRNYISPLPSNELLSCLALLPLVYVIQIATLLIFKIHRQIWSSFNFIDAWKTLLAIVSAVFIISAICRYVLPPKLLEGTILFFYSIFLMFLIYSSRLYLRLFKIYAISFHERTKILMVGAGQASELFIRSFKDSHADQYKIIGCVDDDESKTQAQIYGVTIFGVINDIAEVVAKHKPDMIVIAIPSLKGRRLSEIVKLCTMTGIPVKAIPSSVEAIKAGKVSITHLQEVNIEDLLGRKPVHLELDQVTDLVKDKVVLITGGGGSIGSELCRQVLAFKPSKLIILDFCEFNLYKIGLELQQISSDIILSLTDVNDKVALEQMFIQHKPHIIFHAAAYKHVPMLEDQMRQAVRNNIMGTYYLATLAGKYQVEKFVMVSTDKAVNPTNVMGATKRIAELFCQSYGSMVQTQFITVRFGNVLNSAGSVIPLFREQIEKGGPVTVTHPDMQRYFMLIPEAAQLVLQAASFGMGGEIFVLDMGEPIKIKNLAEQMIELSGKKVGEEIEIIYTGLRPGEKLYEELFYEKEALQPTAHERISIAECQPCNYEVLQPNIETFAIACETANTKVIYQLLISLVPSLLNEKSAVA